jgi:predicted nucleic acid-binding protein
VTRFVIDATVVVQIVLAGGDPGPLAHHELVAPPLVRSESLATVSELTYRKEVPEDAGHAAARMIATVPIRLERPDGLDMGAWEIARSLGWAKTYDAEYVALAMLLSAPLITLDARLRRGAGHLVRMPLVTELP